MDILFLSHCVPYPPDKGEKIRSHHEVMRLARDHRVHVRCFAKTDAEIADAQELQPHCASVHAEKLSALAVPIALLRFAAGACLDTAYYSSAGLRRSVEQLSQKVRLSMTIAYSTVMAPFAPRDIPLVFDQIDVDSEKWLQYASFRRPAVFYSTEGRRLRRVEIESGRRARCVFLATGQEAKLYQSFAPEVRCRPMENGVDFEYFTPIAGPSPWGDAPAIVFVGVMDYFPNADGACEFATRVLPQLRRSIPNLEFWIVGRSPSAAVRKLATLPGVRVTGAVNDVRPYVAAARAAVVPLRIARGIQNKVLEALAMDKLVLASPATARTFGETVPFGVITCETPAEYLDALSAQRWPAGTIRDQARARFTWATALEPLAAEVEAIAAEDPATLRR